jgi:hypothetical protein
VKHNLWLVYVAGMLNGVLLMCVVTLLLLWGTA